MVPDAMLGRYGAAARLFAFGAMLLGAPLVGLLSELAGMRSPSGFAVLTAATLRPSSGTSRLRPWGASPCRAHG